MWDGGVGEEVRVLGEVGDGGVKGGDGEGGGELGSGWVVVRFVVIGLGDGGEWG